MKRGDTLKIGLSMPKDTIGLLDALAAADYRSRSSMVAILIHRHAEHLFATGQVTPDDDDIGFTEADDAPIDLG